MKLKRGEARPYPHSLIRPVKTNETSETNMNGLDGHKGRKVTRDTKKAITK